MAFVHKIALFILLMALGLALATPKESLAQGVQLRPGDLVVADFGEFGGSAGQDGSAIYRVDPVNGAQNTVSFGQFFVDPSGVAVEPTGNLLVADFGAQAIIRVDPTTGLQTLLASGELIVNPIGLDVAPDGTVYVADSVTNAIVKIDPTTGEHFELSSNGELVDPIGIVVSPGGDLLVADNSNGIVRIDPISGAQTAFATSDQFAMPFGIAIESSGDVLVTDEAKLIRVDSLLKNHDQVSPTTDPESDNFFASPWGIDIDVHGDIFIADLGPSSDDGSIIKVDPVTGEQTLISQPGDFINPSDVAVYKAHFNVTAPDSILVGSQFDLRIDAAGLNGVAGVELELEYDDSFLFFVEGNLSSDLEDCIGESNAVGGTVKMALACSSELSGSSAMWQLTFDVIDAPSTSNTTFSIADVFLNDFVELPNIMPGQGGMAISEVLVGTCGDLDGDEVVTVLDVIITLQISTLQIRPTAIQLFRGDLNRDGFVDLADALIELEHVLGLTPSLDTCGPPAS